METTNQIQFRLAHRIQLETNNHYIMYIDETVQFSASKWCEEQDMLFMTFPAGTSVIDGYALNRTGFCFVNADDRLLFGLKWA